MKHLSFYLFAALVTTSVIDVRARPGDKKAGKRPGPSSSSPDKKRANVSETFNAVEIWKALAPAAPGKHSGISLSYYDLLFRILCHVSEETLGLDDAENFIKRLSEVSAGRTSHGWFKSFGMILEIYRKYENYPEENLLSLIQQDIKIFLLQFRKKLENYPLMSKELPFKVLKLIKRSENDIRAVSAEVVAFLVSDEDVLDELFKLFSTNSKKSSSPYNMVVKAMRLNG